MKNTKRITDKDIEQLLGSVLRWGVLLSMVVVIWGGTVYLYRHGHDVSDYATFKTQPNFTIQLKAIIGGIFDLRGRAIIQFGIILLIATPIARVLLSAISFAAEKDYLYVGIAVIVLSVITISMLGGFGG
ncbi:MAG: DUF1634 domain-containing protein [Mucilaginibacter sp.]|uniref:DUF1634 domain-containing protein n=1 Tax=Mucilaginibacter sp. TaxID=1882438 RepID=UPI0032650FD1